MASDAFEITGRKVDSERERQIVTASIVSTDFLKQAAQMLKVEYFQVPWARRVFSWAAGYFDAYGEAPGRHIQDIYLTEKKGLDDAEAELVAAFLLDISSQYQSGEKVNVDYLLDKAAAFSKVRSAFLLVERVKALASLDKGDEAEHAIVTYRQAGFGSQSSSWTNPNDPEFVRNTLLRIEDRSDELVRFPGMLGRLLGAFKRRWLVAIQGPSKRGKSWWLGEIRTMALLDRLKVVEVNLEMSREELATRYWMRISARGEHDSTYLYPVFDCELNQDGSCMKPFRASRVQLLDDKGLRPGHGEKPEGYVACDECRRVRGEKADYRPRIFHEFIERRGLTVAGVNRRIGAFGTMHGADNYRIICYPRFSAGMKQIKLDLDMLEATQGFIPDVIVVDYADVVRPGDRRLSKRDQIDDVWMRLAGMADERHCLVATATHSAMRRVEKKRSQSMVDVSEDTRKINHIDALIMLDQTEAEKRAGVMRVGLGAHRHRRFNAMRRVQVLSCFDAGQPVLDSEFTDDDERIV